MTSEEREILKNIMMNLKGYEAYPSPEQADYTIKSTMRLIEALLEKDAQKIP